MLKRKLASITLLLAIIMATLGLRFVSVTAVADGRAAQITPADPIPVPIGPPPG
jgi:hypothetical protein